MKKDTNGYYALEAAIFLPIFILALLTVGYLLKVECAAEETMHAAADESRALACRAYVQKTAPLFESGLENRIMKDNRDITYADVKRFSYLHSHDGTQGLISFKINYRVDFRLPLHLYDGVEKEERLRCRAFIGETGQWSAGSFDDMENNDDSKTVWVFPEFGIRYHKENCTFVSGHPCQVMLSDSIRAKYKPCEKCDPGGLGNGCLVYCFPYGDVYHQGSCSTVDKYTVTMSCKEAEERGYTPCSKCGGV